MSRTLELGQVVAGRFELIRELGAGSFGDVWLARDREGGRDVALKLLQPQWAASPRVFARFQTEIQVLSVLNHPTIARALGASLDPPSPYLALEFVKGETLYAHLSERARRGEHLPLSEISAMVREVAEGLDHAHRLGILHRDLKPSNLMLAAAPAPGAPRVRILDFGIAKLLELPHDQQTTVGRVMGTDPVLAPEQLRGINVGLRADVFSLGCVAYSLVTSRYAWSRDTAGAPRRFGERKPSSESPLEIARRIAEELRPSASAYRPELPAEVDVVLRRAMATDPGERFASAPLLAEALEAALLHEPRLSDETRSVSLEGPERRGDGLTAVSPSELEAPRGEEPLSVTDPRPMVSAPAVQAQPPSAQQRWSRSNVLASAALISVTALLLVLTTSILDAPRAPPESSAAPPMATSLSARAALGAETPTVAISTPPPPGPSAPPASPARKQSAGPGPRRAAAEARDGGVAPSPLERALEAARRDPASVAGLEALARAIEERAQAAAGPEALAVRRCVASARFQLDLSELEACARKLGAVAVR